MEFNCWKNTYNTFGASSLYGPIAGLLTVRLGDRDYGSAIKEIDVTANLRSKTRNPRPTLEGLFDQFHGYLESLPKVTFRRKSQKIEIQFLSDHFTDQDEKEEFATVENLNLAAREVHAALLLFRKRLKKEDDFEAEAFFQDLSTVLKTRVKSKKAWKEIREQAAAIDQARIASLSPWELLEVDWDDFHPQAREILDEPFFWECTDDFSPHGNDTGADLLEDFLRWNKRSPRTSPLKFLDQEMKRWGMEPIDWLVTNARSVKKLYDDDGISLRLCNEASIALAFATIKTRANCPPEVAEYGLSGIKRIGWIIRNADMPEALKSEWNNAQKLMKRVLAAYIS